MKEILMNFPNLCSSIPVVWFVLCGYLILEKSILLKSECFKWNFSNPDTIGTSVLNSEVSLFQRLLSIHKCGI